MDRLIIRGDVTSPYQHLYVYKGGERIDSLGVLFDDLAEVAVRCLKKYELTQIDLSGSHFYMEGIEREIKKAAAISYSEAEITFKYV